MKIRELFDIFIKELKCSKLYCGVPIPGETTIQYNELLDDTSKLRDFLFVLPTIWTTIINYGCTIYMMKTSSIYPIRILYTLLCVIMCAILTWLTDETVYEKPKKDVTKIIDFRNDKETKIRVAMGAVMDMQHAERRRSKMDRQQNQQHYGILILNAITAYITISSNNIELFRAFSNNSWMIAQLADNIKSLQYYTYMDEFISFIKCMSKYKLVCNNYITDKHIINDPMFNITTVEFVNVSFGYFSDLLSKMPNYSQKIYNLSYTFRAGVLYYIKAPNGIGKTTLLQSFTSNVMSGCIFFGNHSRDSLSWTDIQKQVFHIHQASEFTPSFSKDITKSYEGKDEWLEHRLGISEFFGKDTSEMSGGQRQRMFIYIALTSDVRIVLLDESLSEQSDVSICDVPEGWKKRVINTIIDCQSRHNKIIILVGHGMRHLFNHSKSVVPLYLTNDGIEYMENIQTILKETVTS
jgi:ABC-type cobalamin/Fe3+-siderophores transport system ATPase subunit